MLCHRHRMLHYATSRHAMLLLCHVMHGILCKRLCVDACHVRLLVLLSLSLSLLLLLLLSLSQSLLLVLLDWICVQRLARECFRSAKGSCSEGSEPTVTSGEPAVQKPYTITTKRLPASPTSSLVYR